MKKLVAALLALVAAVAVAGALSPASAAEPTLGATFGPTTLVFEREQEVALRNRSTLPVRAVLSVEGSGWELDTGAVWLEPDERQTFNVIKAGQDDAKIRAILTPADPLPGVEATSLVVELTARHQTPFESINLDPLLLLLLLAVLFLGGAGAARVARRVHGRRNSRRRVDARLARFVGSPAR